MKFTVKSVRAGCRLGSITDIGQHPDKVIDTPTCLIYTRAGSVPHLTRPMLDRLIPLPCIANMPLTLLAENTEIMENYKMGIGKFAVMQDFISYCSVSDPAVVTPTGYNDRTSIGIWGKGGKLKVDVKEYMRMQEAMLPDWFQAMSDTDTDMSSTRKRCRKAVDRTLNYLDECLESQVNSERLKKSSIFGTICGGGCTEERLRLANQTKEKPVAGFVLEGFHHHGPETEHFDLDSISDLIKQIIEVLPDDKPRLMPHCWTPLGVLKAVQWGIDVFDSVYPYLVTEKGCALVFNYNIKTSNDVASNALLSLKDKSKYMNDVTPILEGCSCYTCQNHTRAYVNHLLNTNELLAPVLLSLHNYHHYFGFFQAIREALKQDTFDKLCDSVQQSYVHEPSNDIKS